MRMNGPSVKVKKKEGQTRAPISADLPPRLTSPTFPPSSFPNSSFLLLPTGIPNSIYPSVSQKIFYLPSSISEIDRILQRSSVSCSEIILPVFTASAVSPIDPPRSRKPNAEMFVRCSSTSAHLDLPNHHPCSCPPVMYHIDVSVSIQCAVSSYPLDECACGVRVVN